MKIASIAVGALRSVSGRTGALLGAVASIARVLALLTVGIATGRLGPDQAAGGVIQQFFLGAFAAAFGWLIGVAVHLVVSRTRFAGPADRRIVATGLALVAVIAALSGFQTAWHSVVQSTPRVIQSNGSITRLTGLFTRARVTPATLLYEPFPRSTNKASLEWRDRAVEIAIEGQTLIIRLPEVLDRVSLSGLDYVREVYGATATLDTRGPWLALLVRLRSTGRRELLLIYDPAGTLAHQELLLRTTTGPQPVLWSAGQLGDREEFRLELGEQLRYVVQE